MNQQKHYLNILNRSSSFLHDLRLFLFFEISLQVLYFAFCHRCVCHAKHYFGPPKIEDQNGGQTVNDILDNVAIATVIAHNITRVCHIDEVREHNEAGIAPE